MAATLVRVNTGAQNTGLATVSPTLGGTATAGNLLVLIVGGDDYISSGNRPSGYTFSTGCGQETFLGHYLFWKVAAGGETGTSYTLGSAAPSCWIMAEISGLTGTPYDISNGQLQQATASSYTTPSITPTAGDRYVIASIAGSRDNGTSTLSGWLNSFTERADIGTTLASGTRDTIGYADLSATYNGSTSVSSGATYSEAMQSLTGIIIAFKVSSAGSNTNISPGQATPALTGRAPFMGFAINLPDEA